VTPILQVHNLAKSYGTLQAVRDLSFSIAPGEVFGLLGPNGAGKTTTLECILGLRRPDAGTIQISGTDALANPARARHLLGAQLQVSAFQDKITPRQALRFFAAFYRQHEPIDPLLTQFDLADKADRPFDTLSFGQRRRLDIAVALVHQPKVILLDEPTAGMDPLGRRELHALIARLKDAGRGILLTTHHMEEAHRLCDRVGILSRGSLAATDAPDALIAGSKLPPRLLVKTSAALAQSDLQALAAVSSAALTGDTWRLETSQVNATIQDLMKLLDARHARLLDLQIHHPTLEDVFLALAGAPLVEGT
jgi:ABC-2 type transport system ATP-binding protein